MGIGGSFFRRYIEALDVNNDMLLPERSVLVRIQVTVTPIPRVTHRKRPLVHGKSSVPVGLTNLDLTVRYPTLVSAIQR